MRKRRTGKVMAVLVGLAVLAAGVVGTGVLGEGGRLFEVFRQDAAADVTVPSLPAAQAAGPALSPFQAVEGDTDPGDTDPGDTDPGDTDPGGTGQRQAPSTAGLTRALAPLVSAPAFGGGATLAVVDPGTGDLLYGRTPATGVSPASTAKLVTGAAALAALGPDTRLSTSVVQGAEAQGAEPGEIVLVGGGDPTLTARVPAGAGQDPYPAPARLGQLAADTAGALRQAGTAAVRVSYDDSLFSGPAVNPAWEPNYVPDGVVAPVTALTVDEARLRPRTEHGMDPRTKDPSATAAAAFAAALGKQGIQVSGRPRPGQAAQGARRLATVGSAPVSALVEHALTTSDNDLAEALARQVAVRRGSPASFSGAAQAIHQVLGELGVDTAGVTLFDGSGLSRRNRVPAQVLAEVLALAAGERHPELRAVLTGLPVAGFTGTLDERFGSSSVARGVVRAKTGTLTGVSALAGLTRDAEGRLFAFAFLTDRVPAGATEAARKALDRLVTTLAACGCA